MLISLVMNEASLSQVHTNFHLSAAEQKARSWQNNTVGEKQTVDELPIVVQFTDLW